MSVIPLSAQAKTFSQRLFNETFYLSSNPDVLTAVSLGLTTAFEHFSTFGHRENRPLLPFFDTQAYLTANLDVANATTAPGWVSAWNHFVLFGILEGRSPNGTAGFTGLFDNAKYLAQNADVATAVSGQAFRNGFEHYLLFGAKEGRAAFDKAGNAIDFQSSVTPGKTFTLTTGLDNITGTSSNDTIDGGVLDSWSAFDNIDGGAGNDTMTVFVSGTGVPVGTTITNVETLNINTTGAGYTINTTGYSGLTSLNLTTAVAGNINVTGATTTAAKIVGTGASNVVVVGTGGNLSIQTGTTGSVAVGGTAVANAITSVSVKGGSTVDIKDRSGPGAAIGSTLASVTIDGATDDQTITADGLTSLTLKNIKNASTVGDTTVTAAVGTRALTVTYDGVDVNGDGVDTGGIGGTLTMTDATATTLNIKSSGSASYDVTTNTALATSVTIDAAAALQMDALTAGAATSVAISGDKAVTISSHTLAANAAITSTNSAGVTFSAALGTGVAFTGGAGNDAIKLGATTKAINMGAGDDTVTLIAGVSALGPGGSIEGGDGIDTLAFTLFADAVTASATSTFAGTISGFEKLKLVGPNLVAGAIIKLNNLDNINDVEIAANNAQNATIDNLLSGGTVTFSVTQTNAVALTVAVKNAAFSTNDVVNVGLKSATVGLNSKTIIINDVETINFLTDDTATPITNITHTSNLTANAVKTITVAGDAGLNLTNTSTTITTFNASAVTGGSVIWTTGALAANATIVGSATRPNTIDTSATNKNITYTGGSGIDIVTFGDGNNIIITGGGNDVIVVGDGNNTIIASSGNNIITVGTGSNTITTGAGNDTINIGAAAGLNVINVGSGTDSIVLQGIQAAAGYYASVTGMDAGDTIDFSAVAGKPFNPGTLSNAITLGGAATFVNYLNAAAAQNDAGSTNAYMKWFQFSGNTYIVVDNDDAVTFQDGIDSVIELVGLIDLSNSTFTSSGVLTIV